VLSVAVVSVEVESVAVESVAVESVAVESDADDDSSASPESPRYWHPASSAIATSAARVNLHLLKTVSPPRASVL